ncbi:MAG: protease modulator HflC [Elusimicrobiota bacterium]
MSRNIKIILALVIGLLLLSLIAFAFGIVFIVPETHSAVVTRFGEVRHAVATGFYTAPDTEKPDPDSAEYIPEESQIEIMRSRYEESRPEIRLSVGAGLYFKAPWPIEEVHTFETRILDWDGQRNEVATKDLRTLLVDSASRWRILDPVQFYESVGTTELHAQRRLDEVIMRELEDMITVSLLIETVRNENLTLEEEIRELMDVEEGEDIEDELIEADRLRYGRMHVIEEIQKNAGKALKERFGILLIDVMITELNYTEAVQSRVFDRMIAERQRIASRHRAEGEETKQTILGQVEEERRKILGEAKGREIQIVGSAHNRDRDFYRFFRSLEAYDKALEENAVFILSDDSELLQFITSYR